MLKSSQNIWILEKQNTAEVAGRRRAWEAISCDSSGDKGRAMAVFVLITVELPPWRRYPDMSLALVVMPHLTDPHSCALRHSQAGYVQGRPQQHLLPSPSLVLPWAKWGWQTELWVFPSQLPASPSKPCFPYSEVCYHPPLRIKLTWPFLWPHPSGWGPPLRGRMARKTLPSSFTDSAWWDPGSQAAL